MAKSPFVDDEISLKLTPEQCRVLDYIVRRAQEDPDFFDALGGNDHRVSTVFRMTVARIRHRLSEVLSQ